MVTEVRNANLFASNSIKFSSTKLANTLLQKFQLISPRIPVSKLEPEQPVELTEGIFIDFYPTHQRHDDGKTISINCRQVLKELLQRVENSIH